MRIRSWRSLRWWLVGLAIVLVLGFLIGGIAIYQKATEYWVADRGFKFDICRLLSVDEVSKLRSSRSAFGGDLYASSHELAATGNRKFVDECTYSVEGTRRPPLLTLAVERDDDDKEGINQWARRESVEGLDDGWIYHDGPTLRADVRVGGALVVLNMPKGDARTSGMNSVLGELLRKISQRLPSGYKMPGVMAEHGCGRLDSIVASEILDGRVVYSRSQKRGADDALSCSFGGGQGKVVSLDIVGKVTESLIEELRQSHWTSVEARDARDLEGQGKYYRTAGSRLLMVNVSRSHDDGALGVNVIEEIMDAAQKVVE